MAVARPSPSAQLFADLPVTPAMVDEAAARLAGHVLATPFAPSLTLSEVTGAHVFVKFENLQFTGSFKDRGALNRLLQCSPEERARGVVAFSAGNHAQGVAFHAHRLGIPATIVMPEGTPFVKVARTQALGARVVTLGTTIADSARVAREIAEGEHLVLVHPYDDPHVIAGQGTIGREMLLAEPQLDAIVAPVGGGGLLGGIAVAARAMAPAVELVGVQSSAFSSFVSLLHTRATASRSGIATTPRAPTTIADGIAVAEPGALTRELLMNLVDDVCAVEERSIEEAVVLYLEVEKTVAEGAGAAPLALLLEHPARFAGRRVGLVLSGGNIDPALLSSVILRGLGRQGRLTRLAVEADDAPGQLARIAQAIGDAGANIVDVEHRRLAPAVSPRRTVIEFVVATLDQAHAARVEDAVRTAGYAVRRDEL